MPWKGTWHVTPLLVPLFPQWPRCQPLAGPSAPSPAIFLVPTPGRSDGQSPTRPSKATCFSCRQIPRCMYLLCTNNHSQEVSISQNEEEQGTHQRDSPLPLLRIACAFYSPHSKAAIANAQEEQLDPRGGGGDLHIRRHTRRRVRYLRSGQYRKNNDSNETTTPSRCTRPTHTHRLTVRTSKHAQFPHLLSSMAVARRKVVSRHHDPPARGPSAESGVRHRIRSRHGLPYPATRRLQRFDRSALRRCRGRVLQHHTRASGRGKTRSTGLARV